MEAETLIRPVIEGSGLELVDVAFRRESGRRVLRVVVDREGGVDVDTIAELAEKVSRRLDVEGFAPGPYALEVSSPGIERSLKLPRDFARRVGDNVKVKTTTPVEGRTNITGELVSADDDGIVVAAAGGELRVRLRRYRVGQDGRRLGCGTEEEHTMNAEMIAALRELEREKGIAFETILAGLEEAMASAYKTWWKQEHPEGDDDFVGVRAYIDPETGDLRVWLQQLEEVEVEHEGELAEGETAALEMKVISEEEVEVTDEFKGRIGAQTAKQVIFQKLRDAEREMTYEEFAGREGDIVTGIVQQQERRYTLLDLGKVEALLPQAEQVPSEPYRHGERLKAYITEVRKGTKGPQIVVSRSHPGLLKALFALGGARDRGGHRRDQGGGARARAPLEDRGVVQRARRRPGRRVRRPEGVPRPHGRERAARREDRRGAVEREPRRAGRERAAAGEGEGGPDRRGHEHGAGDRARLPAVARDRQGGAERPSGRAADRMADRHQVRDAGRGRVASGGARPRSPRSAEEPAAEEPAAGRGGRPPAAVEAPAEEAAPAEDPVVADPAEAPAEA